MKFASFTLLAASLGAVLAHPEKLTAENFKRESKLIGRSNNHCAAAIEKRKADMLEKRAARLHTRRAENGHVPAGGLDPRSLHYTTIQNDTCVLAPDTIWGPYG